MTRHDHLVRLRHMQDHAREAVDLLGNKTNKEVSDDRVLQLALARLVEIVGEAASQITNDIRDQYPQIPWREASSTRNLLIHGYDIVNHEILCNTIRNHFPPLIQLLSPVINEQQ